MLPYFGNIEETIEGVQTAAAYYHHIYQYSHHDELR